MATYKNLRKVLNLPTLSESPSSGVNGEMYFNTTDSALFIYDGAWKKATQSAIAGPHDWTATTQQAKLQASDAADRDQLGYSIAISGDTIVAAAYLRRHWRQPCRCCICIYSFGNYMVSTSKTTSIRCSS